MKSTAHFYVNFHYSFNPIGLDNIWQFRSIEYPTNWPCRALLGRQVGIDSICLLAQRIYDGNRPFTPRW